MTSAIKLRPAQFEDADLLLSWRNDPVTRAASHNQGMISHNAHLQWLKDRLANASTKIFIAENDNTPVGTVRAEWQQDTWELSWTLAPAARGQGFAKAMVATLAQSLPEPIRAEIKAGNIASAKIAEYAGMQQMHSDGDILHYGRDALAGNRQTDDQN